jgi:hypothetical protein
VKIDFTGDYAADHVAYSLADSNPEISKVLEYCNLVHTGFEVVVDDTDAMNWLRENKPEAIRITKNVVVFGINAGGEPDFYAIKTSCTEDQYNLGEHYDMAERYALEDDFEGPLISVDEDEPLYSRLNLAQIINWNDVPEITD